MYYLMYMLILFGITYCEESTPNITIKWEAGSLKLKYDPPILFRYQPFTINVECSRFYADDVFNIMCHYNSGSVFINRTLRIDGRRYVAEVSYATKKMSNEWNCNIMRKSLTEKEIQLSISFFAHIRLMEIPGEIRVNDQNIKLSLTNLSVSDYDAVGTYYYVKGELAKFTCHRLDNKLFNRQNLYFNISDAQHWTGYASDINLYLKLGHKLSPNHIDCKMSASFLKMNIRLILEPLISEIEYPQFQVNGLRLTQSKTDYDYYDYEFVYEYYTGEDLFVLSNLNKMKYKSLSCEGVHLADEIMRNPSGENPELRLTIPTLSVIDPQFSVNCLVKTTSEQYYISNYKNVRISIKFVEDSMKFFPYISGIQWPKIIAKFYNNVNENLGTFYAAYKSNENLTLHCSSNETGTIWKYGTKVNSTLLTAMTESESYSSTRTFQLIDNVNETLLECKRRQRDNVASKVVLLQQKELIDPSQQENTEGCNITTDTENTNNSTYNSILKPNDAGKHFLPIIIGVISIIIIILIITLFACMCKPKKLPNTDTEIHYENLAAHNEVSMTLPSQWDTNRSINDKIEAAYARVIPKSQRTKLTDVYSEPLSKMKNPGYATLYNANLESPYAKIIPQSQIPEKVDEYAQIVPKAQRNLVKNQVLPTNDYTKNDTKMRDRVDTDKHKYANVFSSEVYSNVSSSGC